MKSTDSRDSWAPFIYCLALIVLGVAIVALVEHYAMQSTWWKVAEHFGGATIVAGLLGISVDLWFKKELAHDAFKASMGYLLPAPLRPELEWIYKHSLIAESHLQTIRIERVADGLVAIHQKTIRRVSNVSRKPDKFVVKLGLDDWLHPSHPSKINEVSYRLGKDAASITDFERFPPNGLRLRNPKEVTLNPGDVIEVVTSWTEYREDVGSTYLVMTIPTKGIVVQVEAPHDIDCWVAFQHRDKYLDNTRVGPSSFVLNGVLLPFQAITVKWVDKGRSRRWLEGQHEPS